MLGLSAPVPKDKVKGKRMNRIAKLAAFSLTLAIAFSASGCATIFHDSAPVPGTNARLVVGGKEGFLVLLPRIWVLENGVYTRVEIVEED